MFTDKTRSLRNGSIRAILDRTMYGPNSPFAPALRTLSYSGQFQVGATSEGGEPDSFPAVSGFTFTQYSNEQFEYNWDTFTEEDRVIALEFSLDEGESWFPFTIINPNDEGSILFNIADVDGFDSEGGTFIVNDFYYMRARFQDQQEEPTVVGEWTELFFQAENIQEADFPDVENFVFQQEDSTDFSYNWESFASDRVIYIETSWDGVSWDFFTWVDHTETGPYFQTAWTMGGWPGPTNDFAVGSTYYMRVRYQNQYPDPTLVGNFVELSFVAT